jgi:hypothetical protein
VCGDLSAKHSRGEETIILPLSAFEYPKKKLLLAQRGHSFKDNSPFIESALAEINLKKQMTSTEDLFNNQNRLEDYQLVRLLGSGAYATVKLGQNKKTKQKVAIKIYPKYKLND